MSNTRRSFLQSGAAIAASIVSATGQTQKAVPIQEGTDVQVPRMRFGNVEISRLVLGTNQFYGFSHFNSIVSQAMRDWYTPDRVCEVLRRCGRYGINVFNYVNLGRSREDFQKFLDEGGKMHLVAQVLGDPVPTYKAFKPTGIYRQGEEVDTAFENGEMDDVKDWCKKVRDLGALVGVGTHKPEVIAYVEEQGWDVDFYAGCVYKRRRTSEEWKQVLNGEMLEMPQDIYLKSDPARMYKVMRQTKKQCFAFKVLAAGRIEGKGVEQAFRTAFASIKPNDGVFVGMWPYMKDEVRENAEVVTRVLTSKAT
jgi:hypothetical protein